MMLITVVLLLAMSPHNARTRPLGSTVTLEGFVTVQSGVFSSFMNDNGFVLGDALSGIYVATDNKGYRSIGTALVVRGVLADHNGLLILRATDIRLAKGRSLFRPRKIELDQVDEMREGQLVQVEGELARAPVNDLPAGYKLFLRQAPGTREVQVFVPASVRLDKALLTPGRRLRITGWCAQYGQTYEVVVRKANDIDER
jgi:hypothetical protein